MPKKNLLLFILLSCAILFGWTAIRTRLWPPQPRKTPPDLRLILAGDVQGLMASNPAIPCVGNAGLMATQVALIFRPEKRAETEPQPKNEAAEAAAQPIPKVTAQHRDDIPLGHDRFNIKALLTSRGGAVQALTLRKFLEADRLGRPDDEKPLELIPDNRAHPSNVLLHYALKGDGQPETEHPEPMLGKLDWSVKSERNGPDDAEHEVVFTADIPNLEVTVTKTYSLGPSDYHISLKIGFTYHGKQSKQNLRYQLVGAHGLGGWPEFEGMWYTNTYRNALIGRVDERNEVWRDLQEAGEIGRKEGGEDIHREQNKWLQYAGIVTQYFGSLVVVDDVQESSVKKEGLLEWARPTLESKYPEKDKDFLDDITMRVISQPVELQPGVPVVHKYLLYNGPVKVRLLGHLAASEAVPQELVTRYEETLHLNTLTDYGKFGFWTQLLIWCTNRMHGLLWFLHTYVMPWSYGLCIILLTVLVRGVMFPLSRRQALASAKMQAKMQELAPEVKKLEEKYKSDPKGLQQAKTELYLKRGIHPLAMMGSCWIMLLQLPVFLGLYYALQESIHFRLAPFLWIKNLAAPDMLFPWSEHIPLISRPDDLRSSWIYLGPYFNLLPILAVALMMVQQKMMTPPPTDEQAAMQQKMMKWMTVFMGFVFYKVAAGLCIYFIASSLWGLTERKLLPKRSAAAAGPPGKPAGQAAPGRGKARPAKPEGNGKFQKMRQFWQKVLKEAKKK